MKRISSTLALALALHIFYLASCTTLDRSLDAENESRRPASLSESPEGSSERYFGENYDPNFGQSLEPKQRARLEEQVRLRHLEAQLETPEDIDQYNRAKPYLHSAQARIQFLEQGSFEAKDRWASSRGIFLGEATQRAQGNSLRVGMTRSQLRDLLGEPDSVDVAGDPRYGNERWRYSAAQANTFGYRDTIHFIYLEAGQVRGWQTVRNGQN